MQEKSLLKTLKDRIKSNNVLIEKYTRKFINRRECNAFNQTLLNSINDMRIENKVYQEIVDNIENRTIIYLS